jgi:hypothetical protein
VTRARVALALGALLPLALTVGATPARAETRRLAVLVGHNAGAGARPPLRYAERDAEKLARVLGELGGIASDDLFLVNGQPLASLRVAMEQARARVAEWRRTPGTRVLLLFYFSGHSDGQSLEIGRERLPFGELRHWLAETRADVRLGIVDSCRSGALLAMKGGAPGPSFDIHLVDDVATSGEALITSSAADESALESRELGGSFFSHHLVSGLRGAADASGDGRVTLAELYQYAFTRTVSSTADTLIGPQHPAYDYRLSGMGDLVLTEIDARSAQIEVPAEIPRLLIVAVDRAQVLAELGPGTARRVAVRPGEYALRTRRGGKVLGATVRPRAGEVLRVSASDFTESAGAIVATKGGEGDTDGIAAGDETTLVAPAVPARPRPSPASFLALGAQGGVARATELLPAVRAGIGTRARHPLSLALAVATGKSAGFRETQARLLVGQRLGLRIADRLELLAGAEVGGGVIAQDRDVGGALWSGAGTAGLTAGLEVLVGGPVSLTAEVNADWSLVRGDGGRLRTLFLPAAWVGLVFEPALPTDLGTQAPR